MDARERQYNSFEGFDERAMTLAVTFEDDEGDEVTVDLPAKYEVCPLCCGAGKHVNPSIDSNGISEEEFDEDPDFRENYFAGIYDVTCAQCEGRRVVPVPDEDACKAKGKLAELTSWREKQEADESDERERARERRMGY